MKRIAFIVFLFCPALVYCQSHRLSERIDSLIYKSTSERLLEIDDIMKILRENISLEEGKEYIKKLDDVVSKLDDHRVAAHTRFHQSIWNNVVANKTAEAKVILLQALQYAETHNCRDEKANILLELGIQYRDIGYNEEALSYFLKTFDFLRLNQFKIERSAACLVTIGDFYYRMGLYDRAAEFFEEAVASGGFVSKGWHEGNLLNTAGLTFKKLKQYEKAIDYFNKSMAIMKTYPQWEGLITGNIGSVYYEMGQLDKAIPLLEKDVRISLETNLYHSAASALQLLAKIALNQGNISKAIKLYDRALEVNAKEPRIGLERDINEGLAELYKKTGEPAKALLCFQRFTALSDSINKRNSAEKIRTLEIKHEFERQEQERLRQIESLTREKELYQNKQRATLIIGLVLFFASVFIFYLNRQRLQKKKLLLEQELSFNQRELHLYTEKLVNKTNAVEELQSQLDNLKEHHEHFSSNKTELISQLLQSSILTEKDWQEFKRTFEQVHKNFFIRVKTFCDDLTEGEIRLLALMKLNLSSKEMANMLGISSESVNKARYRLRKKLNLGSEESLEDYSLKL